MSEEAPTTEAATKEAAVPSSDQPKTGDTSNLPLMAALLVLSAGAAAGLTVLYRKQKED